MPFPAGKNRRYTVDTAGRYISPDLTDYAHDEQRWDIPAQYQGGTFVESGGRSRYVYNFTQDDMGQVDGFDRAIHMSVWWEDGAGEGEYPGDSGSVQFYIHVVPAETSPAQPAPAFTDTPSWCAKEAQWAVEQGITNGAGSADRFAPTQDCAHEQILTFLWRAAGKPAAAQAPVTVASYYQDGVNWAYEKGFIDSSFQPSAPCTRAQAVWYIWKAQGEPQAAQTVSFPDVDSGASYANAVSWALEKGVTTGDGGAFVPDRTCDRGEIACFLYRAYN